MELDSTEAIESAVEVGLGVGVVSRWALTKELELGVPKITPVDGIRVTRHFTLISRSGPDPKQMLKLQGTDEVIHPVGSNNGASSVTARSYGLHQLRSSDRGHRWG